MCEPYPCPCPSRAQLTAPLSLTVGAVPALTAILRATADALKSLDVPDVIDWPSSGGVPAFQRRVFKRVWLRLAGITSNEDEVAFRPLAHDAFAIPLADCESLKVTNGAV